MKTFEFAVELGWGFEYFEVQATDEASARDKLWNEILTCDQQTAATSIEVTSVN